MRAEGTTGTALLPALPSACNSFCQEPAPHSSAVGKGAVRPSEHHYGWKRPSRSSGPSINPALLPRMLERSQGQASPPCSSSQEQGAQQVGRSRGGLTGNYSMSSISNTLSLSSRQEPGTQCMAELGPGTLQRDDGIPGLRSLGINKQMQFQSPSQTVCCRPAVAGALHGCTQAAGLPERPINQPLQLFH